MHTATAPNWLKPLKKNNKKTKQNRSPLPVPYAEHPVLSILFYSQAATGVFSKASTHPRKFIQFIQMEEMGQDFPLLQHVWTEMEPAFHWIKS